MDYLWILGLVDLALSPMVIMLSHSVSVGLAMLLGGIGMLLFWSQGLKKRK